MESAVPKSRSGGTSCCVPRCIHYKSRPGSEHIHFHAFPRDAELSRKWAQRTKRADFMPSHSSYICSDHFTEYDYENLTQKGAAMKRPILKKTAYPSRFDCLPASLRPPKIIPRSSPRIRPPPAPRSPPRRQEAEIEVLLQDVGLLQRQNSSLKENVADLNRKFNLARDRIRELETRLEILQQETTESPNSLPSTKYGNGKTICAICDYHVDDTNDEKRAMLNTGSPADHLYIIRSASRRHTRNEQQAEGFIPQTMAPLQPPSNGCSVPPQMQLFRHPAGPHPITFPVKEIYCPVCSLWKEEPCWSHTTTVADQAVLPYAVASLPQVLYFGTSTDVSQVQAVFAKTQLTAQTVFGPLVGALTNTSEGFQYALKDEMDGHIRHFDLENDKLSNWMEFVRFAENAEEQNVAVYFRDEQMYFVTTRTIELKEELKVGYSSKYASLFGFGSSAAPTKSEDCVSVENLDQSLVMDTITAIHDYPYTESFLPDCLPTNEDPAVDPICHLGVPCRPEENSHPRRNDIRSELNKTAKELRTAVDAVVGRNRAILPDKDDPNSLPPSVANPLPTPIRVQLLRVKPVHGTYYPVSPAIHTVTDSDPMMVDSKPAVVTKSKGRARKRFPKDPIVLCEVCGKELTAKSIHQHTWLHHTDYCNEHWQNQCSECLERYPTKMALRGHMTRKHSRTVAVLSHDSQDVQDAIEHVRTTGYLTYYCRSCQRHFLNKAIFDIHQLRHRAKDPLDRPERSCPCCSHIAESFNDLIEHSVTHSQDGEGRLCIFCGQRAHRLREHTMERHSALMEEATKDWKFECDECGHRFFRGNLLQLHKKTHNHATSGFQCLYCARVLYKAGEFGTHVTEHRVNGVFKCTCCERTFPKYPLVRLHYRDMHDIKSMKTCDICQEVFRNPQKLKLHMDKIHVIDDREDEPVGKRKNRRKAGRTWEMGAVDSESSSGSEDAEVHPKRIQKGKKRRF